MTGHDTTLGPCPTGARATSKVLSWATRSGLGRLRHVEASTPSAPGWTAIALLVLSFSLGTWLFGNASLVTGLALLPTWIILAGIAVWFLGSEKVLVLDRGIVIGSFAPFLRPYVVPFSGIDPRTVSAIIANQRTVGLLLYDRGFTAASRTVIWSRRAVTFMGISPASARRAFATGTPVDLATAEGYDLWVFSVRSPRRSEPLVRALSAAMRDAGVPGAERIEQHALPPRPLHSTIDDADHLGIPDQMRRAPLRRGR